MAKHPASPVRADFTSVLAFLKSRGIIATNPAPPVIEAARRIHRATYSLILWRFRLRRLPEHGRVFVEEIASDALQILPQTLMGYGKTTKLLIRGIIENTLRHLYFSDHPIEFARMNREARWYVQMEDLFSYGAIHPDFRTVEPRFDAFNRLKTLYGDLSAGVHGRRVQDLEMRLALEKIAFSQESAVAQAGLVERCAESANFLLAVFHRDQFRTFQTEDRRAILQTMPPGARRTFAELP